MYEVQAAILLLIVIIIVVCLRAGRTSLEWSDQDHHVELALELCSLRGTIVIMTVDAFHVHPLNGAGVVVRRAGLSPRDEEHLRSLAR